MKAVYIHIPFCNQICSYCDFPKVYYNKRWIEGYLKSLEKEIKSKYKNELIETIYIGGGTPSSLDINELKKLFEIIKIFNTSYKEFTIECNLDSLTKEKIDLFKLNNINRISVGIESFNENNLKFLNRKVCNIELIDYMKKTGITNINVDLIYALPNQTEEMLKKDIKELLKLDVPHISTYSLIIEPNTVLGNNKIRNIDDELDYNMYKLICEKLKDYKRYETSNFAKPGYESQHNLTYWNNEEYYGFGMGASGYIDNIRYTNTKSINEYINGNYEYEIQKLNEKETIEYEMILGLRKTVGVSLETFKTKYKKGIQDVFKIDRLLEEGKLLIENGHLKIDEKYIYLANEILINFVGEL